ncbi:MAG TPA: hypothetical protein PK830_10660 [Candidatus Atribacteria bacterium]|nr:hypothetical protein [Candidatus Atribacteria bacterium]HPT79536.1 hypothetical protein [Candidatus Atribacteria bacterium]
MEKSDSKNLILALVLIAIMYLFLYSAVEQGIFAPNVYDSYTLQAISWWKGQAHLDRDYSWLELAYYKDRIYVSFPPFPSVPMFLLVPFFGEEVPSNLLVTIYTILSFYIAYLFCRRRRSLSDLASLFWAAFAVFGGNLLSISIFGGVWWHAQALSFLLCILSLYLITSDKPLHWYFAFACWAMSIGCRPFQIVYFPLYMYILYRNLQRQGKHYAHSLKYLIAPAFIGCLYAAYNYIRFDNIFEFGHNYLPEFVEAEYGQFNVRYILQNLPNLFRLPYFRDNRLTFPKFNGFAFYIANPIFIVYYIRLVKSLFNKNASAAKKVSLVMILACSLVHIVLLLAHKTLGGWQFGIRYFIDLIPFLFYSISLSDLKVNRYEIALFGFGLALNIYGTLWLNLGWTY